MGKNSKTSFVEGASEAQVPLVGQQQASAPLMWNSQREGGAYPPPPMSEPYVPQAPFPVQGVPYQPPAPYHPAMSTVVVAPELMSCGHCGTVSLPAAVKGTGLCTWLSFGGMCLAGFWCCAPFLFCTQCTKDTVFVCPKCSSELGRERFPRCLN